MSTSEAKRRQSREASPKPAAKVVEGESAKEVKEPLAEEPEVKGFRGWYLERLNRNPVPTKVCTAALIALAGELNCALFGKQVQAVHVLRMVVVSAALLTPLLHNWYRFLSQRVPTSLGKARPFVMTLADQAFGAPFIVLLFLFAMAALNDPTRVLQDDTRRDIIDKWRPTLVKNWMVVGPAMVLNFAFVPEPLQVLVANCVTFGWNTYLLYVVR